MSARIPRAFAGLGDVLELRLERGGKRWSIAMSPNEARLCADASRTGLWILPASKKHERFGEQAGLGQVRRVYEAWSQFEPLNVSHHRVRLGTPKYLGRAVAIAYRSDKWTGRDEDYEHLFKEPGPRVSKVGSLYRITGRGVRVTPGGVVG